MTSASAVCDLSYSVEMPAMARRRFFSTSRTSSVWASISRRSGSLKDAFRMVLVVRMNLDGSASWRGRSADEILDEFLKPFQDGEPAEDITHLLAINDGRLLEWIEKNNDGSRTPLTADLYQMLQEQAATQKSHIRFINLNQTVARRTDQRRPQPNRNRLLRSAG